jgi:CheY-like chemotaxis protein
MSSDRPSPKRRSPFHLLVGKTQKRFYLTSAPAVRVRGLASTAAESIKRISAAAPALVITNLVLPGIGGMDLLKLLKQTIRTASIPVVCLIPLNDTESEGRCLSAGAAACISKPVQAEDLYRAVQLTIEPIPRGEIRIGARLPVSVDNVPLDCPGGKCEIDLSVDGMYVPTKKPYPRNRRITVQFNIKDRIIAAQGSVLYRHVSGPGPSKKPGIGLKFIDMADQDQEFIRTFIRNEVTRDISAALSHGFTDTL